MKSTPTLSSNVGSGRSRVTAIGRSKLLIMNVSVGQSTATGDSLSVIVCEKKDDIENEYFYLSHLFHQSTTLINDSQ